MNKGLTVITGANSGNGRAMAHKLFKQGYKLLLLDLNTDVIESELHGENVMFLKADVTNYDQVQECLNEGEKHFGPVVNFINNAGIMILEKADIQPKSQIDKLVDINIKGVIYGTQIALKSMKHNKTEGTIINISSVAGIKSFNNHSAYCSTKFAVRGYSETVRAETAMDKIRVGVISPGVVKTNLLEGTTNDKIKKGYEDWRDASQAFMVAEDIANAVSYMLEQPQGVDIREIILAPTTQIE